MGSNYEFQQERPSVKLITEILPLDKMSCWMSQKLSLPPCVVPKRHTLASVWRNQLNSGNYQTTVQDTHSSAKHHLDLCAELRFKEFSSVHTRLDLYKRMTSIPNEGIYQCYMHKKHLIDAESHTYKSILVNKSKLN